jgi:hypothetical protein
LKICRDRRQNKENREEEKKGVVNAKSKVCSRHTLTKDGEVAEMIWKPPWKHSFDSSAATYPA